MESHINKYISELRKKVNLDTSYFYKHSVFDLRPEYASVFYKVSLEKCLDYAYFRACVRKFDPDLFTDYSKVLYI